ncbi:MAG: phage protease, partial [Micromonosporaceae bacterium]
VELVQAGTWNISTGQTTFAVSDLYAAVAALECPAVRRPVLKLGHDENHGQGEACLGYIDNMAVADNGMSLVGDYAGMPAWLAEQDEDGESVLASALPDRSIEGEFDHRCGLGHTHPFVVLAVALLGVNRPGVSSLASLQDIADAYGVPVAAAVLPAQTGTRVVVTASASHKEPIMPNPRPTQVSATVTSSDITRAFYASEHGQSWDHWIVQVELDPLAVIYQDDESGSYFHVPVTLGSGDGVSAVAFGEPAERVMQFAPKKAAAAAGKAIRFASKAESRPGTPPGQPTGPTPKTPAANPAAGSNNDPGEEPAVAFSDEQLTTLRQKLGTPEDADEATILAALDEALEERADPPAAPPKSEDTPVPLAASTGKTPAGAVVIDSETLERLQAQGRQGEAAAARLAKDDRDRAVEAAVQAGKFPPSRKQHWQTAWDHDPEGTKQALASMPPNMVPLVSAGNLGDPEETDAEFDRLFPPTRQEA